jgi:DNA helicase-2/ATP-dependent DNA helicase PcrA
MERKARPDEILRDVISTTNYVDKFGRDNEKYHKFLEGKAESLCTAASQFKRTSKFLHHIEEVMLSGGEEEEEVDDEKDRVIIITGHRAKGLEFKHVYIPQVAAERFPHMRAVRSGMIEEEMRLFYVAMTRAKDTLKVSTSMDRYVSEFIDMAGLGSTSNRLTV